MLLVITGNPGVGKHTIAKKISLDRNLEIIDINKIALESNLYQIGKETKDVDVKKLKRYLKNKIKKHGIIVGHLAPYVLSKEQVNKVIILRKNPYKLSLVYKKRKYSKKKIQENLESEILGIIAHDSIKEFGKRKCIQVDITGSTIEKAFKEVTSAIKDSSRYDKVDWLSLVTNNNDLQKFFSY